MTKHARLVEAFRACRGPFPWRDFVRMMEGLGYECETASGSRRRFVNRETGHIVRVHEPHPADEMKRYMVVQVRRDLTDKGVI
ncbi:type II toxin-antitoxin system HicA family toxin [Stappia sp. TSB10GB4]|uniref:type II toxin-antitoxin system HicA family toxin n=1 Tax=Stappia sp. TSB10GB4 TaxID=2003584 RepID=UPI001646B324|nr:type II toxin-antitoxin system HicA family toxin [Stappia sp. TSB10GB4]